MSSFHVIIPARYGSSRLPGKPLCEIDGKPMIQHVVERAQESHASSVVVATDDEKIKQAVQAFSDKVTVVMTSVDHVSGSDRIAEAIDKLDFSDDQVIVNVQGDEPHMPPALINQVAALIEQQSLAAMATLSAPLDDPTQWDDPSVVKVVTDRDGYAIYFSRAAIPFIRHDDSSEVLTNTADVAQRHIGIYAYRCGYLQQFSKRGACELEKHEKLEQLRVLWHGEKIACATAVEIPPSGIDTPEDLERMRQNTKR